MDIKKHKMDEGQTNKEHGYKEQKIHRTEIPLERHEHIYEEKRSWTVHMYMARL